MLGTIKVKSWMSIGIACVLAAAVQAMPVTAGVIAQWDLDEASGTTVNASVGSINGTINGNVAWQTSGPPSVPDTSLLFGGGSSGNPLVGTDYIDFGTSATLSPASVTVGCWIKANDAETDLTNLTILAKRDNSSRSYELSFSLANYDSGLVFRVDTENGYAVARSSTVTSSTMRADLAWHFVVGTYDAVSGYVNLYVDGESAADPSYIGGDMLSTTAPLNVGRRAYNGSPAAYKGLVGGQLFIMDEAMSAGDVRTMYNEMVPEPSTLALLATGLLGLLAYAWRKRK